MRKFKMVQTSPEGGDCTAPYDIDFFESCIMKEFIDEILSDKEEWGYITINHDKTSFSIEYRNGELKTPIANEILGRKIIFAEASGGWTRMDYKLYL